MVLFFSVGCEDVTPPNPAREGSDVSGSVTRVKTAAGVPNAVIALLQEGAIVRTTFTDEAGQFGFEDIPAGDYTARITALELTGLDLRFVSFAPVEVPLVVNGEPVQLFFAGNGLVAPHVVGDVFCNGSVVPDATIRVIGGDFDRTIITNDQGRFSATNLAAGYYTAILISESSSCTFDPLYRVVELRSGQGATVDFSSP